MTAEMLPHSQFSEAHTRLLFLYSALVRTVCSSIKRSNQNCLTQPLCPWKGKEPKRATWARQCTFCYMLSPHSALLWEEMDCTDSVPWSLRIYLGRLKIIMQSRIRLSDSNVCCGLRDSDRTAIEASYSFAGDFRDELEIEPLWKMIGNRWWRDKKTQDWGMAWAGRWK